MHGSDPPAALVRGINVANRQRSSQEAITVGAKPRRSNPDESRWTQTLALSGWGCFMG